MKTRARAVACSADDANARQEVMFALRGFILKEIGMVAMQLLPMLFHHGGRIV